MGTQNSQPKNGRETMRLFELERTNRGKLPKTAGDAVLKWDEDCKTPSRKDEVITLPAGHSVEMFSLLDGAQFLLDVDSRVFFGGTDERPFLVELDNRIMKHFGGDELQLFNALKPGPVKILETQCEVFSWRDSTYFSRYWILGFKCCMECYRKRRFSCS